MFAYMDCTEWHETAAWNKFRTPVLPCAAVILDPAVNAAYMPSHDDLCCSAKSPPPPRLHGTGAHSHMNRPPAAGFKARGTLIL
jgi:hypothetical protein